MRDLSQKNNGQGYGTRRPNVVRNTFDLGNSLYPEEYFHHLLHIEHRRAERRRGSFILMLIDIRHFQLDGIAKSDIAERITKHLFSATRETDIKGWYRDDEVVGTIFTETDVADKNLTDVREELSRKLSRNLNLTFTEKQLSRMAVSWHIYPNDVSALVRHGACAENGQGPAKPLITRPRKKLQLFAKRLMDILGSLFALLLFAPLFVGIAALIKLSSEGPILFRQERIGLSGEGFMFLKFRSMHVNSDQTVHKEFVKKLMSAGEDATSLGSDGVFKIRNDSRVTPIGRLIRKTSLDELPQFINVLKGEMSLVGPRPPIAYECENYDLWHLRRVLEMKPGITGLWQVDGRSATTFNDMVRMDINYAKSWSLWQDIKIILKTPFAVMVCKGAY